MCDFEVNSLHEPIVVKGAGSQAVNGVYLCWCSPGVEMIQGPPADGSDVGSPVMGHYQVGGAHIIIDVLPNFNDGYARWIVHRTNLSSPLYAEMSHEKGICHRLLHCRVSCVGGVGGVWASHPVASVRLHVVSQQVQPL